MRPSFTQISRSAQKPVNSWLGDLQDRGEAQRVNGKAGPLGVLGVLCERPFLDSLSALCGLCGFFGSWRGHAVAERVGFEPTIPLRAYRFSRPAHSTALPPLPE